MNLAARFADRVIALKSGRIAFDGAPLAFMDGARLSALFDVGIELVDRPGSPLPLAVLAEPQSREKAA